MSAGSMVTDRIAAGQLFFIAGPCLIEGEEMLELVAAHLASISAKTGVPVVLKGSIRKANRTSLHSPTGIDPEHALTALVESGRRHSLPTLTDIHTIADAERIGPCVDVVQVPAFLARQTDLLVAAGANAASVNIKKGQFMAPYDMRHAVEKVRSGGCNNVMVTERGTTFGYHDLVVDMRSLIAMRQDDVRVVFDATHSTQAPSAGSISGGDRRLALPLACAAAAIGVDGLFFETHPSPEEALSDSATQILLGDADRFIHSVSAHDEVARAMRRSAGPTDHE